MHLETPIPSCSIAFSSILGPRHLRSIFSNWYQETGALGFWASGGLRQWLPLVRGRHQLTCQSGTLSSVSIMVLAFSVMRPSSTARAFTHLTVHYPVPTSYSILGQRDNALAFLKCSQLTRTRLTISNPARRAHHSSNSRRSYTSNPYPFVYSSSIPSKWTSKASLTGRTRQVTREGPLCSVHPVSGILGVVSTF